MREDSAVWRGVAQETQRGITVSKLMVTDAGMSGDDADAGLGAEAAELGDEGAAAEEGAEADEGEEPGGKPKSEKWTPEMQAAFDKRIGKEIGRRKELEDKFKAADDELKGLRERADAEDGEAVLRAAAEAGVMPELLGAAESKGIADLSDARRSAKVLAEALEDQEGDEVTVQGESYPRADVKKSLRHWSERREALEKRFGPAESKARERGLEVWRLGIAARKAGWKPGAAEDGGRRTEDGGRRSEDGGLKAEDGSRKPKPKADMPDGGGEGPARKGGAPIEVRSTNDLAAWIAGQKKK